MTFIKKIIYYSLLIAFIICLLFATIILNNQNKDLDKKIKLNNYYNTINKDSYKYINVVEEFQKKYNNDDIKGIINIKGLNISSLILQGNDNNYYLSHIENKEKNIYGSLVLDYRTNLTNSKINLIYGHMSSSDITPFKQLEKYLNHDIYINNKEIEIIDEYTTYKYEIFSIAKVPKDEYRHLNINLNDTDYINQLNWYKEISLYKEDIELSVNDRILILQTCTSNSNHFILVIAKLISSL